MKRRLVGVLAAIVMAGAGTAVLVAYVQGAQSRALAGEQTVSVLVVADAIDKATRAEEIEPLVRTEQIPAKVRADGVVEDLADLEGLVSAVDLVPGEQLVASRFISPAQLADEDGVEVPEGKQEVTISLQPQRAVGGQISPGDTVALFGSFASEGQPRTSKLLHHKLLVTNVQVEQLPANLGSSEGDAPEGAPSLAPTGNLLVTLAVDVAEAERTIFTAEHGSIWLSAAPASASESGSSLRNPENIHHD